LSLLAVLVWGSISGQVGATPASPAAAAAAGEPRNANRSTGQACRLKAKALTPGRQRQPP
jgi:hypothetical protein